MRTWAIAVVAVVCCSPLQAAPLDLHRVCGAAKWLMHVDVDAMRESSLAERAYQSGIQELAPLDLLISAASEEVGIDPRVDLYGITVFGKRLGKLQGVAIIHANMKPDVMIGRAKEESGYESSKYGDYETHSWSNGAQVITGVFFKPSILVVARTSEEIHHALDVLAGKSPSLADKQPAIASLQPKGAVLFGWAEGLANSPLPFRSPAIKKSKSLSVLCGEDQGQVFASLCLVTETPEIARKMLTVLHGAKAFAELQYPDNSVVMDLSKRVAFSAKDRTVSVELKVPVEEAWSYTTEAYKVVKAKREHRPK